MLDEGDQKLIGAAGKASFEYSATNPTIGNMICSDAEGFRDKLFSTLIVQD